jgi:hypothetical protein
VCLSSREAPRLLTSGEAIVLILLGQSRPMTVANELSTRPLAGSRCMGRTSAMPDVARTIVDQPGPDIHKPHASTPGLLLGEFELSLARVQSPQPLRVWDPMVDDASQVNAIGQPSQPLVRPSLGDPMEDEDL